MVSTDVIPLEKLLFFLSLEFSVSGGWILSLAPDSQCGKCSTKQIGEDMTFTCSVVMETNDADKMSSISLRWLNQSMDPVGLASSGITQRVYSNQSTSNQIFLQIDNIRESDAGSYTCEGQSSESGTRLRRPTSLLVIKDVDIEFRETPTTQYPRVNSNALIRCLPEANPQPVTTWFFNGKPLLSGGRYTIAENGLIIHRLTKEDGGKYLCKAEIPVEKRSANKTITVIPASTPMINKPLNDVIGAFGHVTVKCMASGQPVPNYHWFKSGSANILEEPKYHVNNNTGVLIIYNVTRADEGKYICIASNPAGDTIATVDVKNVTETPTTKIFGEKVFTKGENLTLMCEISGRPFPVVYWYRADDDMRWPAESISADDRILAQWRNLTSLELLIRNITSNDEGHYVCVAQNMGGSRNASLDVEIKESQQAGDNLGNHQNSNVLNAAWGVLLGITFVVILLVIGSFFFRRHRRGQRLTSSNMVVCSSCLACIHDSKSSRGSNGGTLENASSKEKIAFSELIDTPENSRKESLSIISTNLPGGKDNDISADMDERDSISQAGDFDDNLNEEKSPRKGDIKGYTELPLA
ncbi:roundabout homolog 2-like [Liolophura sinensis]|uniref:roundabout homolog 2-like n=1 Tax=Liolophura sinensis TaxID=3198878 RepID=UPI00315908BE